jgi:predicted flap endonuclease-1-like 5' DNA nuclease
MENLRCLYTNFPWDIFFFWLLPLLLFSLLLWWWLNKQTERYKSHAEELQDRINFLEGELDACRKNRIVPTQKTDINDLKTQIIKLQADLDACNKTRLTAGVSAPIAGITSASIKKDDLKIVEGIGPKIEELCHEAGIYTFDDLANASYEALKNILDNAGTRFQMHDPTTWPKQAALARDGKWDQLKTWQDDLNKGKE